MPVPQTKVVVKKQSPKPTVTTSKGGSALSRARVVEFDELLKIMMYGISGTGKTTLWSTFPGETLAIIASGGNQSGELRSIPHADRKRIKALSLRSSEEMKEITDELKMIPAAKFPYKNIVLDHASGFQDLIMKDILCLDDIPVAKTWGLASQQTYGQITVQAKEYLRALIDLPCNVIIIAQERTFGGKEDGIDPMIISPTVGAGVSPSLAVWLNSACDYIVETFKRPKMIKKEHTLAGGKKTTTIVRGTGVDYCLRTAPHDVYTTKFRIPKGNPLPEFIIDPTYEKIIKLIRGATA